MFQKGTIPSENTAAIVPSIAARNPTVISVNHLSSHQPRVSEWFQRNCKFVQFVQFLEIENPKQKVIPIRAPPYRQFSLISYFLDLANVSKREEAAVATNWTQDRPEGLTLQNWALTTRTSPVVRNQPKNDCRCSVRHSHMRVIGLWETIVPSKETGGNGKGLFPAYGNPVLQRLVSNMHFECCMLLQGTLGEMFDIFAASEKSTAWSLHWKTRSKPIGERVCPVAQLNLFSTAFGPREWTMVVFWNEKSGRQLQLIARENERDDKTNDPSPPNYTFFDDPDLPFGPGGPPAPHGSRGPPSSLAYHQDGLHLHHLL